MEKQPHRRIEKIAENRWFQNQPRMDDHAELGTAKALAEEDNAPPQRTADDVEDDHSSKR
ncbi:MAG: hypothetical protein HOQ01_04730 [Lysobacter sp.]|nr:hypothetical protein [Lysobacter sp.]